MNDFTKEELEVLKEALLWRDMHILPSARPHELQNKIVGMIENYCAHEHSRTISDVDYVEICRDCERILR